MNELGPRLHIRESQTKVGVRTKRLQNASITHRFLYFFGTAHGYIPRLSVGPQPNSFRPKTCARQSIGLQADEIASFVRPKK
jgi:hypothetical protein